MAYDFSYTQNRELSWLRFNERVLEESTDSSVPLFERLKFVSIFSSNLDEFFMIRVGGLHDLSLLKKEPVDNKSNMTASQQLEAVFAALPRLMEMRSDSFDELESMLSNYGLERVSPAMLNADDKSFARRYYEDYVQPILSPMIIDPRHPFPNMKNLALYAIYSFDGPKEKDILGMLEIPSSLPRIVELPSLEGSYRYMLIEDLILSNACLDFGDFTRKDRAIIRVTRNADINPDDESFDEDGDYRQHMKRVLKKRMRLQPVRLELQGEFSDKHIKFIRKHLRLSSAQVFKTSCPLDLSYSFALESKLPEPHKHELLYPAFSPQESAEFDESRSLLDQVAEHDRLLFFPYQSMQPFLDLMKEAAYDPEVLSIKITLYRIARHSKLAEYLIAASENGKEVTVLMELRARFDEENNILWAERLEEAGCKVSYGKERFKVHSKICQITRMHEGKLQRITQLGTGNYNEKTAKLYSDISLMTADEAIGEDANEFFKNMSLSQLKGNYSILGVAPYGLKPLILAGIEREIERARQGKAARIIFKMNSLTDRDVIDKLVEASQLGVEIKLIIRGITCLLPGIQGRTDTIEIKCIVGRFLEHTRIYAFGTEADTIYCSSADMMTRNTEHRTEIAFPILDPCVRGQIISILEAQLKDTAKARWVDSAGLLRPYEIEQKSDYFDSQAWFMEQAKLQAQLMHHQDASKSLDERINSRLAQSKHIEAGQNEAQDADKKPLTADLDDTQNSYEQSVQDQNSHEDKSKELSRIAQSARYFKLALRSLFGK